MTRTYKVNGMTCSGCSNSLVHAIGAIEPEARIKVDVNQGIIRVEGNHDVKGIRQAVENAGFSFEGEAPGSA